MKNIHLMPPDKLSRLYEFGEQFILTHELTDAFRNDHICITSDEEIKEGWYFNNAIGVNKPVFLKSEDIIGLKQLYGDKPRHLEKIVLTTDQDLIKDGVQGIDDEFLEWFVKNPSCESVEVERLEDGQYFDYLEDNSVIEGIYENYKIIIPIEGTPQETNEEASKRIYPDKTTPGYIDHWSATERRCFIEGAQWSQQEILYFLYEEMTERRPYSSSKMCEVVIEFIQKLNKK
jgi:hypothetical protein